VVFVADSRAGALEANVEVLENTRIYFGEAGVDFQSMPLVFQYNKRDFPDALTQDELRSSLNTSSAPEHLAVAKQGTGVFLTLKDITKLVFSAWARAVPRDP
jgi:hypothetical protein